MATNVCSRSRTKYIKVKDFANQYEMSSKTVYQMLKNPIFDQATIKIGNRGVRINQDLAFEIMQKYYK